MRRPMGTKTPAERCAESIRAMLAHRGIRDAEVSPWEPDAVEIRTLDAHPDVQIAVRETADLHRLGDESHTDIFQVLETGKAPRTARGHQAIHYQVPHILHYEQWTPEFTQRLQALIRETQPDYRETGFPVMEFARHLFRGYLPGFWTREAGEDQPARCRVCQEPAGGTDPAAGQVGPYVLRRHDSCKAEDIWEIPGTKP